MDTMEQEWRRLVLETKDYRTSGTRILASVDETQQLLDDHIVKTQAMKGSRQGVRAKNGARSLAPRKPPTPKTFWALFVKRSGFRR